MRSPSTFGGPLHSLTQATTKYGEASPAGGRPGKRQGDARTYPRVAQGRRSAGLDPSVAHVGCPHGGARCILRDPLPLPHQPRPACSSIATSRCSFLGRPSRSWATLSSTPHSSSGSLFCSPRDRRGRRSPSAAYCSPPPCPCYSSGRWLVSSWTAGTSVAPSCV